MARDDYKDDIELIPNLRPLHNGADVIGPDGTYYMGGVRNGLGLDSVQSSQLDAMIDRDEPLPVGLVDLEEADPLITWFSEDEGGQDSDHDECLHSMSFATDTTWPLPLKKIFAVFRATHGSLEDRYYGAYDKLPPKEKERDAVDFIVYLVVRDAKQRPVFLLEVKDDTHREVPSLRHAADTQMRDRYNQLLYACPIPTLYGVSAMGTDIRVYTGDVLDEDVSPAVVPTSPTRIVGREYLKNGWNLDLLSDEGFAKIKEIVNFIKQQCALIQD
ncbi:hypothetical protein B0H14DRAFT_3422885 [Mycena olivaceomarginata]|nr:hypothetical protein B0H14DRAFT_3422885 [Mycena olivaceomarginata]